ncbi:hypothetical protein BHM03_00005163 [Ensete ventricosum]|nr:hypothetical protein BHM03_00005163 [Ensete ventricosum]
MTTHCIGSLDTSFALTSYRYADRPLLGGSVKNRPSAVDFGSRRPIEVEIDRRRSIEEEKGKKKRKRKEKEEGKKEYLARLPSPARRRRPQVACTPSSPRAVFASGSPVRCCRPQVARSHGRDRFFSRARRRSVSPCEETDRGDVK